MQKSKELCSMNIHTTLTARDEPTGEQCLRKEGKLTSISPNLSRDMDKIDRGLETVWLLGESFPTHISILFDDTIVPEAGGPATATTGLDGPSPGIGGDEGSISQEAR